jgi:chemotaxis protein MotB
MSRLLPVLLLGSVFIGGCVPLNMHGALREAYNKLEAEQQAVKKELAQASAESKRLQQEAVSLKAENEALARQAKDLAATLQQVNRDRAALAEQAASARSALAAREAEKAALAAKAEEHAVALRQMEASMSPKPPAVPEKEKPSPALEAALKDEIANGSGVVRRGEGSVAIELLEPVLYHNSASATIKPEGLKVLKRLADALKGGADKEIRVEAHTDVVIQTSRFPSNADLAMARANGVLRFLKTQNVTSQARLSAVGYAEPRQVTADGSSPSVSRNRRVEIIIRDK